MNSIISPELAVITPLTADHPENAETGKGEACPICGAPLRRRAKYCRSSCRVKAYRIRQVDKIIERFREELIKEIVK